MPPLLLASVSGELFRVPTDQASFDSYLAAKQRFSAGAAVHEKFGLFLDNFHEWEATLLSLALEDSVYPNGTWLQRIPRLHVVGRRFANLLTTARLYIDQVSHDISSLYGSDRLAQFKSWTNEECDNRLGYRVMEALRNFVQHRAIPIANLSIGWRAQAEDSGGMVWAADAEIDLLSIEADGGLKASVLKELIAEAKARQSGTILPLKGMLREYVAGLAVVHRQVGHLIEPERDLFSKSLEALKRIFSERHGVTPETIYVFQDGSTIASGQYVFSDELLARFDWAARTHAKPANTAKTIVSTQELLPLSSTR